MILIFAKTQVIYDHIC